MSLAERCVIVTRPRHQAEGLCRALASAGAVPIRLPLIDIDPCAPERIPDPERYDRLLWTSPNAVHHGLPLLGDPIRLPPSAAIGAATAAALSAQGIRPVLHPAQHYSTEGLLALPAFASVEGKRFLLLKGRGGRTDLTRLLRQRGARVTPLCVYRRRGVRPTVGTICDALDRADAAIVTSGEILQRLHRLTPTDRRDRLLGLNLVVPSDRVVQMASTLGFLHVLEVPSPLSNDSLVQALQAARYRSP